MSISSTSDVLFHPEQFECFRVTSYEVDPSGPSVILRYALDDRYQFSERFDFVGAEGPRSSGRAAGFGRTMRLLHIAAGVSYYKTAAPRRIVIETGPVTDSEMSLCRGLYDQGMREFAFRNRLPVPRDLEISTIPGAASTEAMVSTAESAAAGVAEAPAPGIGVPIGGGKDSVVVLEALDGVDTPATLVSVNPGPAAERIASISGMGLARIRRALDPLLFELNGRGALNGHVPVTAIVSLVAVGAGYLYGYDTTAMALESSADSATRVLIEDDGKNPARYTEVNHQWSKSAEFEVQLQRVLRESVHDSIRFLSPLRRFTELEITSAFATLPRYLNAFRSCNRAFRIGASSDSWCCDCPKCRFVFLALAAALPRGEVVAVFGSDMLDDETQAEGFCDMLDDRRKPFECVGTVDEVVKAFRTVTGDPSWSGARVVELVRPLVEAMRDDACPPLLTPGEVFSHVRRSLSRATVS